MTDHGLIPRIEFNRLWGDSNAQGNGNAVFFELVQLYSGPRREYHTLGHVMWVLKRIDEITSEESSITEHPSCLLWAAWFHDAIMDGKPDDEARSAKFALDTLTRARLPHMADDVHRLILATAHGDGDLREGEAILSDADLSILGAPSEAFDEYESRIRLEWAHVSDADFAAGRARILQTFLDKPRIYFTEYGRERWEERARENLAYSIGKLREPSRRGGE